ncbi:MAG: hypothetical protein AAGK37_19355 [Pseudomonadota bacterium]
MPINLTVTGDTVEEALATLQALIAGLGAGAQTTTIQEVEPGPAGGGVIQTTVAPPKQAEAPQPPAGSMSPAEARDMGIALSRAVYANTPDRVDQLLAIQEKFNVAAFTDIKDEDALEFLAAVKLVEAGAAA